MVNFVRIYRNNEFTLLPLEDYLIEYNSEIPEGWDWYSNWIINVFHVKTEIEYTALAKEAQIEYFDVPKIKDAYVKLKNTYPQFDDDILRFFAFLLGTHYFSKIGSPSFDQWINAYDINNPFREREIGYGFSFTDALKYKFGQNAIRKNLLSTMHWISSQGGS